MDNTTVLGKLINRLTDNYNKNPQSNVYKTMQLVAVHAQENEDAYNAIQDWLDIDNAQGTTLDIRGKNFQQPRGQATDDIYRLMIKAKIKRNLSHATIDNIIDFLSFVLQVDPSTVKITELWQTGSNAAIHIDVPTTAVNKTGLTVNQFAQLVKLATAGGVRTEINFGGTFSFSSQSGTSETDSNAGFADVAETTGGTLSGIFDSSVNDYNLPV